MKKCKKYCALILHYCTWEQTKKGCDSILKLSNDIQVVIVDNASNDGSGEKLKEIYEDTKNVNVLILKKSEGFSYGNNYGYRYIKSNYDIEFLFVVNNDVVVYQHDFCNRVDEIYKKTKFGILGPDIYVPKKKTHQNPQRLIKMNLNDAIKEHNRLLEVKERQGRGGGHKENAYRLTMQFFQQFKLLRKIWHFLKYKCRNKEDVLGADYTKQYENIQLHGSALIFSSDIIKRWDNLFWPETKFYYEEYILYERTLRENIKTVYSPDLQVYHLHEYATRHSSKRNRKNNGDVAVQRLIDSIEIYIAFKKNEI